VRRPTHPERPTLVVTWTVLRHVIDTIGSHAPETGGPLGSNDDAKITHFHFDATSNHTGATYTPADQELNRLFADDWNPHGIRLRGFIHSHPGRLTRPSPGDEDYAGRILDAINDLDELWLPIITETPDAFRLTPWLIQRRTHGVDITRANIRVERVTTHDGEARPGVTLPELLVHRRTAETTTTARAARTDQPGRPAAPTDETFSRVTDAYDLAVMAQSRLIAVGAGGAAAWLEDVARAGLGQFILIDPDTVTETNLATQQAYRRDLGRAKVDALADRIRDINPGALVIPLARRLEELDDDEVRRLATQPLDGRAARRSVACGLTDNFFAQARVNRVALSLGLPSLCAQVYQEGRAAEVTFTYPGVTPACHRCILSARYRHYLEHGLANPVTSRGAPIFATTRLNAVKGFILLALLHHGTRHPRWGPLLGRIGNRNLVQIRLDPDLAATMGLGVFDRVFERCDQERVLFDETVWLPQAEEGPRTGYPPCPDCGGTGDLRQATTARP